jgi:hypothetical protein
METAYKNGKEENTKTDHGTRAQGEKSRMKDE